MNTKFEIVERSSGYWVVDDLGVRSGPYETEHQANINLKQILVEESGFSLCDTVNVEHKSDDLFN